MKRALGIAAASLLTATLIMIVIYPSALAAPPQPEGTVRVTIRAPEGVAANAILRSVPGVTPVRRVASKPPAGQSSTTTLTVPAGAYFVDTPRMTVNGVSYVGRSSRPVVPAAPRVTFPVDVTYVAEDGARDLAATEVTPTSIRLKWTGPPRARYTLRRTEGAVPAGAPNQGVPVPVVGTTASDIGLRPGTQYSYALYTTVGFRQTGPVTLTAGTAPSPGSDQAAYIAMPTTLITTPDMVTAAQTTGDGVRVTLSDRVPTPVLGAGVTMPISDALPGGYLGVVNAVSPDGRVIDLVAGGLSDAFDYYELNVDEFSTGPVDDGGVLPDIGPVPQLKSLVPQAPPSASPSLPGEPTDPDRKESSPSEAVAPDAGPQVTPFAAPNAKIAGKFSCTNGVTRTIEFDPRVELGGSFRTRLDKKGFLGAASTATLDMRITATAVGAAKLKISGNASCTAKIDGLTRQLSAYPVPIAATLTPTATISVDGAVEISDIGLTATGGAEVHGTMSLANGASFNGSTVANAAPLTPKITANGRVGLKVGGDLLIGPGVGTPAAGVIAGVKGSLYPIDASFSPVFTVSDARFNSCVQAKAALNIGASLTAKFWLNNWKFSKDIPVDALQGTFNYPGSPWQRPLNCGAGPSPGTPPDSVYGPGVTKVNDQTTGQVGQVGELNGFAPGKKAWVLSTGLISDAAGQPSATASTNLGQPGDDLLSTLSGHQTYDAAAYTTTIVPTGKTLHVRYVFASEEYPEYVGSQYNDVMSVQVNGLSCAFVPGTTDPVAINTVNGNSNSQFYVDNSAGAAGYSTSMDGLTVPLECTAPVTPGQPVTVRLAVADSSDGVLDSAIALVDGGIFTD